MEKGIRGMAAQECGGIVKLMHLPGRFGDMLSGGTGDEHGTLRVEATTGDRRLDSPGAPTLGQQVDDTDRSPMNDRMRFRTRSSRFGRRRG